MSLPKNKCSSGIKDTNGNSSFSAANKHEQRSQDGNGGHDYQGNPEQTVTTRCRGSKLGLRGGPPGTVGDGRGGGFHLIEDSAKYGPPSYIQTPNFS